MEKRSIFRIQIISPTDLEIEYLEGEQFVIGRSKKAQISIDENGVSRQHLSAVYDNGALWLQDNHSSNGTYVNGKKINPGEPYLYKEGQTIRLGPATKTLRIKRIEESEESQFKALKAREYAASTLKKLDRLSTHFKDKAWKSFALRKEEGRELYLKTKKKAKKRAHEILYQHELARIEIDKDLEKKEGQLNSLQKEISANGERLQRVKREYQDVLSDLENKEDQLQNLKGEVTEYERLKKEKDEAEKRLKDAQDEENQLKETLEELGSEKQTLQKTKEELHQEATRLQKEKSSLEEEIESLQGKVSESKEELSSLEEQVQLESDQKNNIERAIQEYNEEIQAQEAKREKLMEETAKLLSDRDSLNSAIVELNRQKSGLEETLSSFQTQKKHLETELSNLKQEKAGILESIETSQKEAEQHTKKLKDQLEADEVEFKLRKTRLENDYEEILHQKLKSDKELYETNLKLDEAKASLEALHKENDELLQTYESQSQALEKKQSAFNQTESKLKALKSEIKELSSDKEKALKETELAVSEKRVLEMEKLKQQEADFWKTFRSNVAEKAELLSHNLQDKMQKSKESLSAKDIEKLVRSIVLDEAGLDKEVEKKDFATLKKERAYWRRFAMKSAGVVAALVILAFSPYYVDWISKKAQQYALSQESAAENFVKDIKEKRRLASTFEPEKTEDYKDSYTDNVLFTKAYLKTKEKDSVQQKWVLRLRDLILEEFELKESQLMLALEVEANLIRELKRLRDRIRPAKKDEGISRLKEAEKDYLSQMESLLGGPRELQRFLEVERSFMKSHL